jgi:alpha-1,2-mannosyltransferase
VNPVAALNRLGAVRALTVIVTLMFSAIWAGEVVYYGVIPVRHGLYSRVGGVAAIDFQFFYSAATFIHEGRPDRVYDSTAVTARAEELLQRKMLKLVWAYPPPTSMVLWPLGGLPPRTALLTWIAALLVSLLALGRVASGAWRYAWLVLLFPGAGMVLLTGQFTAFVAPFLAAAFLYFDSRPALSGGLFGALVLKPQFALAVPLYAIIRRRWAFVAAAGVVATLACVGSLAWFGAPTWAAFVRQALDRSTSLKSEAPMFRFVSVFATLVMLGMNQRLALLLHMAGAVLVGMLAFDLAANGRRASSRAMAFCAATILLSPYALDYDLILLGLPWLLLLREACQEPGLARETLWRWLALTWLVPISYLTSLFIGRPIAGPLLWVYLAAFWAAERHQRRQGASANSDVPHGYLSERA